MTVQISKPDASFDRLFKSTMSGAKIGGYTGILLGAYILKNGLSFDRGEEIFYEPRCAVVSFVYISASAVPVMGLALGAVVGAICQFSYDVFESCIH